MRLTETIREKPIEILAAITLTVCGVGLSALATATWADSVGGVMAAIGGALVSCIAGQANSRSKAIAQLKPELQSTSRHLADTVTKISRNMQQFQVGSLDAETAMDRIAQLTTSLYGTVNDVQILVGAPPDFQTLVDTVNTCEEMAVRLEEMTDSGQGTDAAASEELNQLRGQLESARLQLASSKRELAGDEIARIEERVRCPVCGNEATVMLGESSGDSAIHTCANCAQRFHIHRNGDGKAFTRSWGGLATKRMEVDCPACHRSFPLRYHVNRQSEDRYCLTCDCLLRIDGEGHAVKLADPSPIDSAIAGYAGTKALLKCPDCSTDTPAIWRQGRKSKFAVHAIGFSSPKS